MKITDVRVRKITKEGKMKAIVSITIDDEFVVHDIKVIEGEKGLFIAMPSKKATDGERAAAFIDGLLKILKIPAFNEVVSDGEKIEIEIKTTNTSAVIGRRGEVLDAIQCIAGAVANIGREEYRRVVVDCENYRAQREEKLKQVALAKAAKAVERKRRIAMEPMSPYERRVVHSVLADNEAVTTVSEGKEPMRRVVIIPKDEVPFEKKDRRGGRQFNRDRRDGERKPFNKGRRFDRRDGKKRERPDRAERGERPARPARSSAPRGKKQIFLGTFLGNSGANTAAETPAAKSEEDKQ